MSTVKHREQGRNYLPTTSLLSGEHAFEPGGEGYSTSMCRPYGHGFQSAFVWKKGSAFWQISKLAESKRLDFL